MIPISIYPSPEEWKNLIRRPALDTEALFGAVRDIRRRCASRETPP